MQSELLTPHEALQALIDGKDVEYRQVDRIGSAKWEDLNDSESIYALTDTEKYELRLKPKPQEMVTIGDTSFPKPCMDELKDGQIYYIADLGDLRLYSEFTYNGDYGDSVDRRLLKRGLVHLTKENAIAHAKALIKLRGGNYE